MANLTSIRTYVRDLTGVYSTDLVSDSLLTNWINEAYHELARSQEWTFASTVVDLVNGTDTPVFPAEYHPLLAYRVAAKVLDTQADDTPRGSKYMEEYAAIVAALYQDDLQSTASGVSTSFGTLVKMVRDLLSVYDDTITDAFIQTKLSDEYDQLYDAYQWAWTKSPFTNMGTDYTRILAYGVASRLALASGKESLAKTYQAEYDAILEQLKRVKLYVTGTSNPTTLAGLRVQTRALLQDFSKDLPDVLLNTWVNESYITLASERDWAWLEEEALFQLSAGTNTFQLTPSGSRKIMELYVVKGTTNVYEAGTDVQETVEVPSVLFVESNDSKYNYDVTFDGLVRISPTPTETVTFKVRYAKLPALLTSDSSTVLLDSRFTSIIAYRAAIKGAIFHDQGKKLVEVYAAQAQMMLDAMVAHYQLSHKTDSIQLGSNGLETRKYLPFFKVG